MTRTQVANLAVYHMGGRAISDLTTDDTQEAIVIRAWFDAARDELLRAHPWNFATVRASLSALSSAPVTDEFNFQAQLPNDCIKVIYSDYVEQKFVVEGRLILSDEQYPVIKYVSNSYDVDQWPQDVVNAFSFLLASYIAQAINGPAGKAMEYRDMYEKILLPQCKFRDSKEMREKIYDRDNDSEIIIARQVDWYSL